MALDIQLKVMLSPEQYVCTKQIAEFNGESQSGWVRRLIVKEIRDHALMLEASAKNRTGENGHE